MNTGRKFFIILLLMVGVGIGGYILVKGDVFPVAVVDSGFISARTFDRSVKALAQYYEVSAKNAAANNKPVPVSPGTAALKKAMLAQLIQDELIARNFHAVAGKDADAVVLKKLESVKDKTESAEFQNAVRAFYGLSIDEFKDFVLIPEARREVITDALRAKHEDFEAWVKGLQTKASVFILLRGFSWEKGELKAATN